MKRALGVILGVVFLLVTNAFSANMLKPEVFKEWLEKKKSMIIVDIQPAKEFAEHHFNGSIETNAFPVKTEEDKKKLDPAVEKAMTSKDDIVIICPRGRSGAQNTYEYFKSKGIDENRLYILEGGIAGWPYAEMFQKKK